MKQTKIKISGAVFDLDGTLLDSMDIWDNIAQRYLERHGQVPKSTLREELRPLDLYESAVFLHKNYTLDRTPEQIVRDIDDELYDFYRLKAPLKAGVPAFLQTLKDAGKPLAIATATSRPLVDMALERTGIAGYFDYVVTCPDVKCSKEKPDIYLNALHAIGTRLSETPVFEDALFAIETAQKAGFPVVGVYEKTADPQRESIKATADIYVENILEALDFLEF